MQCYGFPTLHYVSLQETCTTIYALCNKCTKNQSKGNNLKMTKKPIKSKGNNSKTEQGRVMVLKHSPSSHSKKHAYQVWRHLNICWQCYPDKKCFLTNKWVKLKNGTSLSNGSCALHVQSLPEISIPCLEYFEHMVTKLRFGQEMLYINQSMGKNGTR